MTKRVFFIQGGGKDVHDQWDNKLVASLAAELGASYAIDYPRMPDESNPSYVKWKAALAKAIAALPDDSSVVAHSIGATILVHALAETPLEKKLAGIFLIATPFIGPGGWPSDEIDPPKNLGARLSESTPIYFFHGTADKTAPVHHVELYEKAVPQARVCKLEGRDHQLNDDMSEVAAAILASVSESGQP